MLSIVIPSYKDPLLCKTIESLLDNAEGDIEIIPVLDGYQLKHYISRDPRVFAIPLKKNVGMRDAINMGVANAKGKYIMRTDEHCMFGKGYDRILTEEIEDNWIVTPRRYKLDTEKWEVMEGRPVDVEKLIISPLHNKFHGVRWRKREKETKNEPLVETMAMQGSCWVMPLSHWKKVITWLDSKGYGTHYQDSIEMVFKTWQAGGKLMSNKKTWYAHRHRKFPRTHNYSNKLARASFDYGLRTWGDYYRKEIKPRWGI